MENRKAIILDLDGTLEYGYDILDDGHNMMVLRPNLNELIGKLQEAKNQGIDVVLCSTASQSWVNRFLELKPEFRDIFDRVYTRDNEKEWNNLKKETNPLEYEIRQKDADIRSLKPVTTFGYDSVLFIDDNRAEGFRLESLFQKTQGELKKDVTFFTGYGFRGGSCELFEIFGFRKAASKSEEIAKKLKQYLDIERNEPGCHSMCSAIDDFMNKSFTPGLTLVDREYSNEYSLFNKERSQIEDEIRDLVSDLEHKTGEEMIDYSSSTLATLKEYMSTDKKSLYEGLDASDIVKSKREELSSLIQEAIEVKEELDARRERCDDEEMRNI